MAKSLAPTAESFGILGGGYRHAEIQYIINGVIPPFKEIFSVGHLFKSWNEFRVGKHQKADIAEFSTHLVEHLQCIHKDMLAGVYIHGQYIRFWVNDHKLREIHKAPVRDRIVHHALYRTLYPYFDRKFIYDSYSCRLGKGTFRALKRFDVFVRRESHNHTRTVWVLSCDIKKCFASVDHRILKNILARHIVCPKTLNVLNSVIDSFHTKQAGKGIPLGNLTSQLFINIYLNELDQCMKRTYKVRSYIRYADDFIIMSSDRDRLLELLPKIGDFLEEHLSLQLRSNDWPIQTVASGVDFLGWVNFLNHRVLRNTTKWRMFRRLERSTSKATLASYHGLLGHGNGYKLRIKVDNMISEPCYNNDNGTADYPTKRRFWS